MRFMITSELILGTPLKPRNLPSSFLSAVPNKKPTNNGSSRFIFLFWGNISKSEIDIIQAEKNASDGCGIVPKKESMFEHGCINIETIHLEAFLKTVCR